MRTDIPEQPRDPAHPIYAVVQKYIVNRDAKKIAEEVGVSPSLVSNVKAGRTISKTVWPRLVKIALKRKQDESDFMQFMTK